MVTNKHYGDVHSKWIRLPAKTVSIWLGRSRTRCGDSCRRTPSRNAPNTIHLLVPEKRLTKMLNQHLWIDIFKNKIWVFDSPDSDTRFENYGTSKFTYLYTNFNPRKTVKWPDLGNGLGCWLLLARGSMAALGPALACSVGPEPLGLRQHEATVFFLNRFLTYGWQWWVILLIL